MPWKKGGSRDESVVGVGERRKKEAVQGKGERGKEKVKGREKENI